MKNEKLILQTLWFILLEMHSNAKTQGEKHVISERIEPIELATKQLNADQTQEGKGNG